MSKEQGGATETCKAQTKSVNPAVVLLGRTCSTRPAALVVAMPGRHVLRPAGPGRGLTKGGPSPHAKETILGPLASFCAVPFRQPPGKLSNSFYYLRKTDRDTSQKLQHWTKVSLSSRIPSLPAEYGESLKMDTN